MPYITVRQQTKSHQITFEDVLFDRVQFFNHSGNGSKGGTVTFFTGNETTIAKHISSVNIPQLIATLQAFNSDHEQLFEVPRVSLYHTFYIPKQSGGYRRIDEPLPDLMNALRLLKQIFEERFNALHHTSAFAYVRGRCAVDAVRRHQSNQSRWFLKTDFANFFGSTTEDFLWQMISLIFPFSEVVKHPDGAEALKKALSLCFLNGGLPQGTPISPMLTNLMMIPFDFKVCNRLRDLGFIYTRYADDIQISHRESFDVAQMCDRIDEALEAFNAPFKIKPTKTRYGSTAGRNWNLGVMLNKDNKITVGRKNKSYLKSACHRYLADARRGVKWEPHDISVLLGKMEYFKMVEPDYVAGFLKWFNEKNNVNLKKMLRDELK